MTRSANGLFLIAVVVSALGLSSSACSLSLTTTCPDGKVVWGDYCPPPPPPTPQNIAQKCHVVRQDCLVFTGSICTSTTPVTFDAITCGKSATDACNRLCVNAGLPTIPYTNCSSSPISGSVPTDPAFCNTPVGTPGDFDLTCVNTGRECTHTSDGTTCDVLASTLSSGTRTHCEHISTPGFALCANFAATDGKPLFASRVTSATYTPHGSACPVSSALTASDMDYRMPTGTPVPVSVAGQNLTLTTSGGHMVVTYSCDGESCSPYQVKDFWLGLNPTTINGTSVNNIVFTSAGANGFLADQTTLDPAGPGFRVSASANGATGVTYYNPSVPVKFVGSLGSAPFTLASTFDLPIKFGNNPISFATAHVTMNLAGSTFSGSGSPGGVQINCGNNGAIPPFVADTDFSGGAGKTRNNVIDLTGVVNPAPMTVYQSQHFASPYTYTIPGFTSGSSHLIRLHFAETNPANNAPNRRKFSVAINGTTQISNLDLFATVGMNKAYIKEFTLNANTSGKYVLSFTASLDSATISAIEVL
jgi:Malectin domain